MRELCLRPSLAISGDIEMPKKVSRRLPVCPKNSHGIAARASALRTAVHDLEGNNHKLADDSDANYTLRTLADAEVDIIGRTVLEPV